MNRFFRILSLTLAAMIIIAALPTALPSALAESDGMVCGGVMKVLVEDGSEPQA